MSQIIFGKKKKGLPPTPTSARFSFKKRQTNVSEPKKADKMQRGDVGAKRDQRKKKKDTEKG